MKLYQGTIHVTVLVAADNEEDAVALVTEHAAKEAANGFDDDVRVYAIRSAANIPKAWCGCLVYHAGGDELTAEEAVEGRGEG